MKISESTLKAAQKAAEEKGMSLDEWADKALAEAASSQQPAFIESLLKEMSRKIDSIAESRHLGEKASDQIGAAFGEIGASLQRIRKTTERVLDKVRTQTGSAVGEVADKARDAFDQVGKTASGLVSPITTSKDAKPAARPTAPAKKRAVAAKTPVASAKKPAAKASKPTAKISALAKKRAVAANTPVASAKKPTSAKAKPAASSAKPATSTKKPVGSATKPKTKAAPAKGKSQTKPAAAKPAKPS
jgi:hypothetical protein